MKTIFMKITLLLLFLSFLLFPTLVLSGAKDGLLLWYQIVLPTLLPFLILTSLIIRTNTFDVITRIVNSTISKLFKTSSQGSFSIIIGFMCGYPMGAKAIHDLYIEQNITHDEAQYLLSFCNNTSPMFLVSFLIYQTLYDTSLLFPSILAIYGSPIIISFFTRRIYHIDTSYNNKEIANSKIHKFSIPLLDECMIDSFALISKVGGYIMIFSIFIHLFSAINHGSFLFIQYLLPLLEITNGITMIEQFNELPFKIRYLYMIFSTSFGGLCAIAQTQCVLHNTDIKMKPYFIQKIITAIIAVIISIIIY